MNVPALPGTIIAELVVQNMRSKGRFEKIVISKESSGIKVRKMRSKEIDTAADRLNKGIDVAHMSFRVNNPALTTSVIVYDSSSFKGRLGSGSDYANKILVDIAGLSIKQAIDKINTFAEQKYRYRLKAIAFCSPISLDIREIIKSMKIDYAYNLIVTKYHTKIFNLRSK